jgi:D-glycero-D-manno-heptose 1,7-bisphosphate phosphatase
MRSAVFFERDGILNLVRVERGHQVSPLTHDEFHLNPEVLMPVRVLKQAGFLLLATTCQPGLSRGYQSRRELDLMHRALLRSLPLDDIFVCPHDETDRCPCRKPKPGLLIEAAFKWHLDLEHCFVVSHKWQDADAARNAGCTSILIQSPWIGDVHRDYVVSTLSAVPGKILQLRAFNYAFVGSY